jgi:hypothetical protein
MVCSGRKEQIMETVEEQTVAAIMDDLDNYGGHLPIMIEDLSGHLYEVGLIMTRNVHGDTVVTIELGDRVQ